MLFVEVFENEVSVVPLKVVRHHDNLFHIFFVSNGVNPSEEFIHTVFTSEIELLIVLIGFSA